MINFSPNSEGTELVSAVSAAQQWASTGKGGDAEGTAAVGKVVSQSRFVQDLHIHFRGCSLVFTFSVPATIRATKLFELLISPAFPRNFLTELVSLCFKSGQEFGN